MAEAAGRPARALVVASGGAALIAHAVKVAVAAAWRDDGADLGDVQASPAVVDVLVVEAAPR